nr:hypothetical protein [uncultured Methanolobus sp.]
MKNLQHECNDFLHITIGICRLRRMVAVLLGLQVVFVEMKKSKKREIKPKVINL